MYQLHPSSTSYCSMCTPEPQVQVPLDQVGGLHMLFYLHSVPARMLKSQAKFMEFLQISWQLHLIHSGLVPTGIADRDFLNRVPEQNVIPEHVMSAYQTSN